MTQQKGKQHITNHPSQRANHLLQTIKETPTSNSEAHSTNHQSPIHLNERSDVESQWNRPLVEEREEFFALSREEEKAV